MSEANSPDRDAVSAQSLNGAWFRRERERVAIGRKPLAIRLGTEEWRLTTLELRKQDVPTEWLGILAELGFRIPQRVSEESPPSAVVPTEIVGVVPDVSVPTPVEIPINTTDMGMAAISESSPPSIPVVDVVAAVADAGIFAPSSVGSEHLLVAEISTPASEIPIAVEVPPTEQGIPKSTPADTNMTTSVDTKSSETESARATKNETQWTPLYGRWLRDRREQKGISTSDMERSLGVSTKEINTLERNNIRIPLAWIPTLLKRRVLTVAEAKAAVQMPRDKSSAMNGAWLRKQRVQRKLKHADVASKIGISGKDVEMIEARKWPLPAEWFPALKELFAPPRGAKAKKPAPMPKKAKPPTTAKADKAAAQTAQKTAPKTAASAAKATPKSTKADAKKQAAASRQDTEPRVATAPVSAAKTATARTAHGLTETIVNYRLMLGERAGLSAVEVLAQIAADLQLAGGKDALTYEQLRAVVKVLTAR